MAIMSSLDLELIHRLKEHPVLRDVSSVPGCRRVVYVGCPDCDKIKDKFRHHGTAIGQKPHPVGAIHGGGAGFHNRSPLNGPVPFPWSWFCYKINEGFVVKNTNHVAWYVHVPCGAAYAVGLNVAQLLELSLTNRGYFIEYMQRNHCPDIVVTPYIHVDFTEGGRKIRRTYEVSNEAWIDFRDSVAEDLKRLPYRMPLVTAA